MITWLGYIAYTIGTRAYVGLVRLLAPFNQRAKKMIAGRSGLWQEMEHRLKAEHRKIIWYHCASLGEFEQVRPLMETLRQSEPKQAILITFFSPSGYEMRKNYQGADYVFYLPFDTSSNARKFLQLVKPVQAFFTKYDIWFHYLTELHRQNIPVYLVSANFRPSQVYFKWYGTFFRKILNCFTHIFSQFDASTRLLQLHGIQHASTSGDTRFDRVAEIAAKWKPMPEIELFAADNLLLVAGSSYGDEEELVRELIRDYEGRFKAVVVPHHVDAGNIKRICALFDGLPYMLYSALDHAQLKNCRVLIVDRVGLLANLYHYADIAFVGGGFHDKGIHNILEPLAHGVPVLFGPENHDKFPETEEVVCMGAGFTIHNLDELRTFFRTYATSTTQLNTLKEKSSDFIKQNTGATRYILGHLKKWV